MTIRVAPLAPPYSPQMQAIFERIMPPGVPPLVLFTTLARDERLYERFRGGALLDKGHLSLRQREIVIHRVTARCGSEYEWGVHAAFFARQAELDDAQLTATVHGEHSAPSWTADEQLLVETSDAVLADCDVSDDLWLRLRAVHTEMAIVELVMLIGFYRTVSSLTKMLRLPFETFAKRFPQVPDA